MVFCVPCQFSQLYSCCCFQRITTTTTTITTTNFIFLLGGGWNLFPLNMYTAQIRGFAVQEAIVQTAQSAVGSYGLKTIKGEFGNLEVLEEVSEIAKSYKDGDIVFTATINAIFDPDLIPEPKEQSSEEDVIVDVDAEVVVASMDVEAEVA